MVLTRAQNQPGPDGVLGDDPTTPQDESADDIQNAYNTDSPWVDQSQTYTSHASHQVSLRDYDWWLARRSPTASCWAESSTTTRARLTRRRPPCYNDGNATDGNISTWAAVKQQAAQKLGLLLQDKDVIDIPMLATDPYGEFIPGPPTDSRSTSARPQTTAVGPTCSCPVTSPTRSRCPRTSCTSTPRS